LGGSAAIQDRQRQVLKDVTSALTSKIDLSTILHQIVVGIANSLDVVAVIIMLDQEKGRLCLQAQSGLDRVAVENVFNHRPGIDDGCITGQTVQYRQPFVSQDIATDEKFPASRIFFTELGIRSIFSYPLVTGTTVFGALLLCSPEPGGFTPLKADICSLFASQATIAIQNGMLLESAHRRSRFQEVIEQLERVHAQEKGHREELGGKQRQDELELLTYVREETQRTFGVNFTSLLRFISDHLLTQSERNLQAMLYAYQAKPSLDVKQANLSASPSLEAQVLQTQETRPPEQKSIFADTLSLLTQMAEVALVRTGIVGELSRLIMQLKQSTNGLKDAWFVVDLNGICMYMNPAAEALCGMRMEDVSVTYGSQLFIATGKQNPAASLENIFARLLPRMRNVEEVRQYLQGFIQEIFYRQELHCILSVEPVHPCSGVHESMQEENPHWSESAPSDYHYRLIRHPLCNQEGYLIANALQVCDITEQVRDEKNRSALLSSVSHDLRTPLTTIKVAVTGLLQSDIVWSEEDRHAMLEDINAETDHLTVLVNAVVELSRIEMGALVLEKEWCDVVEVVHGTLAKMKCALESHPVRILFQSPQPLIYLDHVQLERVFHNLIEHAVSRSPEYGEIIIKLAVIDDYLYVRVADYGEGIPKYERERIFTSFYSLRSYSNGLALAICKGVVEAHQGHIWMEAGEDEIGACFVFTLPLHSHVAIHTE